MRYLVFLISILLFASCEDEVVIKPAALLRLEYPAPSYDTVKNSCNYSFEKNTHAKTQLKNNCAINLVYPHMNATIYLTYQQVRENNLDSMLYDAQKLTYEHNIKAQSIFEQPRVDSINNVYGMFYAIEGNAATQSQFYVTDSIRHFVTGSLYFNAKPNYDSIYPAAQYLRNDIRRIMESIKWDK